MGNIFDINVPDLGGVDNAPVNELFVAVGDVVKKGDNLAAVETEKTVIELPTPYNGTVQEVSVAIGDSVVEGQLLFKIETDELIESEAPAVSNIDQDISTQVVVLGSGPGGYSAAFHAAHARRDALYRSNPLAPAIE